MQRLRALALTLVTLALLGLVAPPRTHAFCGFYAGGADQRLYANATLVVLLRDGNRTVLSIARAGAGPAAATGSVAYFAVGAREQSMMKDDLDALVKVLRRRSGRYLKLRLQLFPHDDHDSIFPAAVAQGLLAVFPPPPRVNKP